MTEERSTKRIWENGRVSDPVQGVPSVVYRTAREQGGLLDVKADPNFATNHLVYISYVEADPQGIKIAETGEFRFGRVDMTDSIVRGGAVARARLDGNQLRNLQVIWRQVPKTVGRGHFGNRLVFAPDVWTYGHRNILAAAFDATGRLWALEIGPLGGDELNLIKRGRNYGWPFVSNGDN